MVTNRFEQNNFGGIFFKIKFYAYENFNSTDKCLKFRKFDSNFTIEKDN